jgi:hypothetical protein
MPRRISVMATRNHPLRRPTGKPRPSSSGHRLTTQNRTSCLLLCRCWPTVDRILSLGISLSNSLSQSLSLSESLLRRISPSLTLGNSLRRHLSRTHSLPLSHRVSGGRKEITERRKWRRQKEEQEKKEGIAWFYRRWRLADQVERWWSRWLAIS